MLNVYVNNKSKLLSLIFFYKHDRPKLFIKELFWDTSSIVVNNIGTNWAYYIFYFILSNIICHIKLDLILNLILS